MTSTDPESVSFTKANKMETYGNTSGVHPAPAAGLGHNKAITWSKVNATLKVPSDTGQDTPYHKTCRNISTVTQCSIAWSSIRRNEEHETDMPAAHHMNSSTCSSPYKCN
jgi:hypothetical protein